MRPTGGMMVGDEGFGDGGEGGPNSEAYGHFHQVTPQGELLELFDDAHGVPLRSCGNTFPCG